ncbi:MAG: hypothetical protein Q9214_002843, partial [Letrouitia sp. 1 TL-2023]
MSHPREDLGSNLATLKLTPFDPSKYSNRVNSVTSSSVRATKPEPAYSLNEHWEGSMTSGVTDYEAPSSTHSPAGSSEVTETPEVANYETVSSTSRLHDNDLNPPSMTNRAAKAEPMPSQAIFLGRSPQTSVPATAKLGRGNSILSTKSSMYTKVNTLTQSTTHGRTAVSASRDAPFPCTYADCSRGFQTRPALKEHKIQEHDYCRVCDMDFEDDDAFNAHK